MTQSTEWTIEPVTSKRWSHLERLFGPQGATEGCWCMHWRTDTAKEYSAMQGSPARDCFKAKVKSSNPRVGLIAYDSEEQPVGWCSVAPRNTYGRRLKRTGWTQEWETDEDSIWAIVCFYIAPSGRQSGLTESLVQAAKEYALDADADIIEAYPNDPTHREYSSGELYMGTHTQFVRNGFEEVARPASGRVVVAHIRGKAE